ncbi:F-box/kelch-repeat protein At3g06240-like [Bidens hawaiensis]|uniref:F-box/kelch-repeat protein At3g06240-like n=1 Tax=Bidens hawaiensis TaxID=980011 RepID=UPI00404ACC14
MADCNLHCIVGSCNGLVCVSPRDAGFLVTNPSTRQQKILQTLPNGFEEANVRRFISWGFGYDSYSDDYKVVAGLRKDRHTKRTTFHVLTLKSNTWKVIGELEYRNMYVRNGILCDGVLYWFMTNKNINEKNIISLDLSTEELKEPPQPDDADYNNNPFFEHKLGLIQDCLCIYQYTSPEFSKIWVMKNNRWELYIDQQRKYDVAHCLNIVDDLQKKGGKFDPYCSNIIWGDSQKRRGYVFGFIRHYDERHVPCNEWDYIRAGIFVKSLEDNEGVESGNKEKRNRNRNRSKRSCKHKKASGC